MEGAWCGRSVLTGAQKTSTSWRGAGVVLAGRHVDSSAQCPVDSN